MHAIAMHASKVAVEVQELIVPVPLIYLQSHNRIALKETKYINGNKKYDKNKIMHAFPKQLFCLAFLTSRGI